jgi:RNA polymerase sigma-70 factor (ECF subfamily)
MDSDARSEKRNLSARPLSYISWEESEGGAPAVDIEECRTLSDGELLRLVALRSRQALGVLYDRYAGAVYSLAMQMLRDSGAAEEVTQDAFFNVWRRASSYRPDRGKVTSWLFSIGHHRVIDELRRRRRREHRLVHHDVDLASQPADDTSDPARYAMAGMERARIKQAPSTLRSEQREVVVLAYYGDLTHSEIAKRLGQPLGTVKTRTRLALKKLREVMGPQAHEWVDHGL